MFKHLTVFDHWNSHNMRGCSVKGFKNKDEAHEYYQYIYNLNWGYSPSIAIIEENGEIIVTISMYNSCD